MGDAERQPLLAGGTTPFYNNATDSTAEIGDADQLNLAGDGEY